MNSIYSSRSLTESHSGNIVQGTLDEWYTVFSLAGLIYTAGGLVYAVGGTSDLQPWAQEKDEEETKDSLLL